MKKCWVMICSLTLLAMLAWGMKESPRVNLEVKVVNEGGEAIEGAQVAVTYPGRISGEGETFKKLSDEKGYASFSGSSFLKLQVKVEKDRYYYSYQEVTTFKLVDDENLYSDQMITMILREVKNPVPMYAYKKILAKLPVLNERVGFDMMEGDWIAPHGEGKVPDILLEVTGEWNGYRDHDSLLTLHFPNQGDGYLLFTADSQSHLRSPYEAPLLSYLHTKSWRKMKRPVEGDVSEWVAVEDSSPDANYILRVRTILAEDGDVKQANYGKIYGDFKFWGATLDKYGYIEFTYYLNPTPNDRNLEFDPSRNLFEGLSSGERVLDP